MHQLVTKNDENPANLNLTKVLEEQLNHSLRQI